MLHTSQLNRPQKAERTIALPRTSSKHALLLSRLLRRCVPTCREEDRQADGGAKKTTEDGRTVLTGRTDGGRLVRFPGDETMIGKILPVTVTGATTWSLVGEPAARP